MDRTGILVCFTQPPAGPQQLDIPNRRTNDSAADSSLEAIFIMIISGFGFVTVLTAGAEPSGLS